MQLFYQRGSQIFLRTMFERTRKGSEQKGPYCSLDFVQIIYYHSFLGERGGVFHRNYKRLDLCYEGLFGNHRFQISLKI